MSPLQVCPCLPYEDFVLGDYKGWLQNYISATEDLPLSEGIPSWDSPGGLCMDASNVGKLTSFCFVFWFYWVLYLLQKDLQVGLEKSFLSCDPFFTFPETVYVRAVLNAAAS